MGTSCRNTATITLAYPMPTEYRQVGDQVIQVGDGNTGIVKNGTDLGARRNAQDLGAAAGRAARTGNPVDVCLIIPTRDEFDYARDILRFGDPRSDGGGYYHYPFAVGASSLSGVAVVLFEMGQASSAVAATSVLARYDVRALALVGIAGALSPKLRLGDVVIASSIEEYLYGARATPAESGDGVEFDLGGVSWQAKPEIVSYINNFRYLHDAGGGFSSWRERTKHNRDPVLAAGVPALAGDYPDYLVGPVATGDIVSAAASFSRWLRQTNRFRAAIEMEAGGAARAIYHDNRAHLMVIRGISDFSDERKGELDDATGCSGAAGSWRRYAMHNALDLFLTLVANPLFPWPDPAP